jgi:hypothetical protein
VLAAAVLAGCGGTAAKPPRPRTFTYADNGHTVTLATGRRAVIKLDTLNWTFQPIAGAAVRAVGPQRLTYGTKGCNAPNGCGYVQLTVDAVARGQSVVSAERGSCGEAARCPPDRRKFAATVVVH